MKTLHSLLGPFFLLSFALAACASAPDDGADDRVDEVVDQSSSALMNSSGGGLTANQCTSCGCTLQQTSGPDGNGCRTYRCVCDSVAKAKCVVGSKAAASGALGAATLSPDGNEDGGDRVERSAAAANALRRISP